MEYSHLFTEVLVGICSGICSLVVWKIKKEQDRREKEQEKERKEREKIFTQLEAIMVRLQQIEVEYRSVKDANKRYNEQIESILEHLEKLDEGQFAQLKDRLSQSLQYYIRLGYAPAMVRETMDLLVRAYEGHGGDGFIHSLYKQFKELPLDPPVNETKE